MAFILLSLRIVIPVTSNEEASTVSENVRINSDVLRFRSNPSRLGGVWSMIYSVAVKASNGAISSTKLPFISSIRSVSILRSVVSRLAAKFK